MFFQQIRRILPLLRGIAACLCCFFAAAPAAPAQESVPAGNAENGKILFRRHCGACHYADKDKNKIGPSLQKVFGRQAGQAASYHYSAAMEAAGAANLRWTAENLRAFLKSPRALVPGTRMPPVLPPLSAAEMADIIRYLAANSADKAQN